MQSKLALLAASLIASACAVTSTTAPKREYHPKESPRCSTKPAGMVSDVLLGALFTVVGGALLAEGEVAGALGLLGGAGHAGSAIVASGWARKCRARHTEHHAWVERHDALAEQRLQRRARAGARGELQDPYAGAKAKPKPRPPARPAPAQTGGEEKHSRANAHLRWPRGPWADFWREVQP